MSRCRCLAPLFTHSTITSSTMSTHVLLTLLAAVLLLHTLAIAQSPQSIADVQIESISGCVDVYPVTVNCSVGTNTLRIQTVAGFPANVDMDNRPLNVVAHVADYSYFVTGWVWADPTDTTNRSVYVNVSTGAYYPHITGVLVSLSFIHYWTNGELTSPAFFGFSYQVEGPPTLTAIAGCDGSGQSTLNCVPGSAVIELTGSGLLWYSNAGLGNGVQVNLGNQTVGPLRGRSLRVVNDSYATLSLMTLYNALFKRQNYAGVLLPFNLTSVAIGRNGQYEFSFTTNTLYISFAPLPPPNITSWYVDTYTNLSNSLSHQYDDQCVPRSALFCTVTRYVRDCKESAYNAATYDNCLPTISQITLSGDYLVRAAHVSAHACYSTLYSSLT